MTKLLEPGALKAKQLQTLTGRSRNTVGATARYLTLQHAILDCCFLDELCASTRETSQLQLLDSVTLPTKYAHCKRVSGGPDQNMGKSERPEHTAPPDIFYNAEEARKYTTNSRIMQIQVERQTMHRFADSARLPCQCCALWHV